MQTDTRKDVPENFEIPRSKDSRNNQKSIAMSNYRILVVDDEEDLCEILKFNLENEGYEIETANSAE